MNSLSKFMLHKVVASSITSLILLNVYLLSFIHLGFVYFLIIYWSGLTISAKSENNLLTKLIFPIKDCISFLSSGGAMIFTTSILLGSIVIPSIEITNQSSVPSSMEKILFFGFNEISYHRHRSNISLRCGI
jgi:hypothetical protein